MSRDVCFVDDEGMIGTCIREDKDCHACVLQEDAAGVSAIRPEIMRFAAAMEKEMVLYDTECGDTWKQMSVEELKHRLFGEYMELAGAHITRQDRIREKAVYMANFLMMLYYRCGGGHRE